MHQAQKSLTFNSSFNSITKRRAEKLSSSAQFVGKNLKPFRKSISRSPCRKVLHFFQALRVLGAVGNVAVVILITAPSGHRVCYLK
jgi:hypothetical protein